MKKLLAIGALVALPLLVYGQAFRVGRGAQFRAGTTAPSPSPTPAPRLWSKSSDNNFPYWTTTANVD
jgi:hypothetical protein